MAVRKKVTKKRMKRAVGVAPAARTRKPKTGGPLTKGPRSSRVRKKAGAGAGGGSLRGRFAHLGPAEKRAAAKRIAAARGRR